MTESTSSAFHPSLHSKPTLKARIHSRLGYEDLAERIIYRTEIFASDAEEIRALHEEWFPVQYRENFYTDIVHEPNRVMSIIACLESDRSKIVGLAVVAINRLEREFNFSEHLLANHGFNRAEDRVAYVLTLGVIDEYRKRGIGQRLIEEVERNISLRASNCRAILLHVIQYNEKAAALYERAGFQRDQTEPAFYQIDGVAFNGIFYYKMLAINQLGSDFARLRNNFFHFANKLRNNFQPNTNSNV